MRNGRQNTTRYEIVGEVVVVIRVTEEQTFLLGATPFPIQCSRVRTTKSPGEELLTSRSR